jgi:hypothetical protein
MLGGVSSHLRNLEGVSFVDLFFGDAPIFGMWHHAGR